MSCPALPTRAASHRILSGRLTLAMALVFGAACAPHAVADEPTPLQKLLRFDINSVAAGQPTTPIPDGKTKAFGERGGERLTLNIGVAEDEGTATDVQLFGVAWSRFVVEDVEMLVEGSAWHFEQEGDDAQGLALTLGTRWHVLNRRSWSLFLEGGIGVLGAPDNVPEGGTGFDFMPRLGMGGTFDIGDSGVRAIMGLRWHHISNGRIHGDVANPSRDAPMVYAGISLPF